MKKTILSLFVTALIFSSCKHSERDEKHEENHVNTEEKACHHEADKLQLNGEKKWGVNPEMMIHIRSIEKELMNYKDQEHQTFGKTLQGHINELTQSCTMNGKAHDELHKWLMPFIEKTQALVGCTNPQTGDHLIQDLKKDMKTFNQYFE
jgi:hypothetical protein